jgi:hypothetical protein
VPKRRLGHSGPKLDRRLNRELAWICISQADGAGGLDRLNRAEHLLF